MKRIFTLLLSLSLLTGLQAQMDNNKLFRSTHDDAPLSGAKNITFSADSIQYWVGTGSNSAVFIVGWDTESTPIAHAWGIHWNGSTVALDLIDTLCTYDPRLSYDFSGSFLNYLHYDDSSTNEHYGQDGYFCYMVNGAWASAYNAQSVADGDVIEVSAGCMFELSSCIAATNPYGSDDDNDDSDTAVVFLDKNIDSADIVYWIGNGERHVILAVNWADTCLAWGLRFEEESITARQLMDAVAAADWRFSYTAGGFVNDIRYIAGDRTLGLATVEEGYNYWWSNLNGTAGMGLADVLHSGDLLKWGDISVATGYDYDETYGYYAQHAFLDTVLPVDIPQGLFCGIVGTEGCDAIPGDSDKIKGWATGCTVTRGWENIATQERLASYGHDSMAVGAVNMSDNLSVVSLGDGGSATLTFAHPIVDGEGPDFAVFENSFNDLFLELAFVEVSSDGEHFVRFPSRSLTQAYTQIGSVGHVNATFIHNLAGKYRTGYGTPFDLAELADSANLDIHHITHVRIIDVVGSIDPLYATYDATGRPINDPFPSDSYSTGFDLDGIGVLNQEVVSIPTVAAVQLTAYPSPSDGLLQVSLAGSATQLHIYDMMGRLVQAMEVQEGSQPLDLRHLPKGVYLLSVQGTTQKIVLR